MRLLPDTAPILKYISIVLVDIYCSHIEVYINEDNSITVKDDGRGIPTGMHEKEHRSALEVVLTVLHAGGKFSKDSYKVSGGLHGVGVSCVNALSDYLKAEIHREGKVFVQEYSQGKPYKPVEVVGEAEDTGTTVTFHPDPEIFQVTTVYKYDTLAARLRELAYLNKGIHLSLTDKRNLIPDVDENGNELETSHYRSDVFYSKEGLKEFVEYLDGGAERLIETPIYLETDKIIPIEIALQYNHIAVFQQCLPDKKFHIIQRDIFKMNRLHIIRKCLFQMQTSQFMPIGPI